MANVIRHRIKPQVYRKKVAIKTSKTVHVVIKPSTAKVKNLHEIKQVKIAQPKRNNQAAVAKPRSPVKKGLRRKKSNIKYTTREAPPESIAKIKEIREKGRGKTLIIVGNGPSIAEVKLQDLKGQARIDMLSINRPDERIWPTSYWAFFDRSQLRRHKNFWDNYNGTIFNSTSIKEPKLNAMQFKNLSGVGFSEDLTKGLYIGRSSVFASMQIALWMNYDHIYIFGCDMSAEGINGKLHFYGTNPDVEPRLRGLRFEQEARSYDRAAEVLDDHQRSKFTFCSEYNNWPFIDRFNKLNHKTAIEEIL